MNKFKVGDIVDYTPVSERSRIYQGEIIGMSKKDLGDYEVIVTKIICPRTFLILDKVRMAWNGNLSLVSPLEALAEAAE